MKTTDFLQSCAPIVDRHRSEQRVRETEYNIYKLLRITHNEVLMCRILADLLNPSGMHGSNILYLKSFLKDILHLDIDDGVLKDARVYKEYPITNERRIDIVIAFRRTFIPIEVKINAGDQDSQCYDYYQYAIKRDKDACIVYLTKDGYGPSEYSLTGKNGDVLPMDKVRCISFEKDIMAWLESVEKVSEEVMKPLISQYKGAVGDFISSFDEDYTMEIVNEIIRNSDSLRTAIEIADNVNRAKCGIMQRLFKEFECQMEPILSKYGLEEETRSEWFHYKYQADESYYAHTESSYPGINYIVKSAVFKESGLSLWFRIEVDNRLFGSLCLFNYDMTSDTGYPVGNQQDSISESLWDELRTMVELPGKRDGNNWIVAWRYIPTGSSSNADEIDLVPDFKAMNDAAIALADDEKRRAFVERSIKVIEETILSLLREDKT